MFHKKTDGEVEYFDSLKSKKKVNEEVKNALKNKNENVIKLQIYRISRIIRRQNR